MMDRVLGIEGTNFHRSEPWVRLGNRSAIAMLAALVVLAIVASISGAVVSPGTVTVDGNYKTVQHLDGGIVSRILVKNGDLVRRGDVLMRLDETAAQANLAIIQGRVRDFLIQQERLIAERERNAAFDFPEAVRPFAADPLVADIMATQRSLFAARRASHLGELSVLDERVAQVKADITGQQVDLKSKQRQLELANKELKDVEPLFKKGFASQQRYGGLQREQARLEGEIGRLVGDMARTRGALAEAELKIAQNEKDYTQSVVDELKKVQAQLAEAEEQRKTYADKLQRIELRAPESGRVHALAASTEGGVVQAGTAIMQVIPDSARLAIEAQVAPQDIDKVRDGSHATVRFPAFDARTTPKIDGRVTSVSAAELTNQQGRTYFTARIEIPPEQIARLGVRHRLVPGMPAEVYIETSTRSIMSYLLKPLEDAMARSFRD